VEARAAADALVGSVDLIVDGGRAGTIASTVVDATVAPWRILRQGAVRIDGVA
jgi:tRNA A37 threonylcarbamoyladenosine synthetase subunit TsaC/SUA5/YrdC